MDVPNTRPFDEETWPNSWGIYGESEMISHLLLAFFIHTSNLGPPTWIIMEHIFVYQEWLNDTTIWHYWTIFTQLQPFPKKNHPGPQGLCPLKLDIPSTWLRYSLPWHQTKLLQIMVETPIQCRDCWYTYSNCCFIFLLFIKSIVFLISLLGNSMTMMDWKKTTRLILTPVSFHEVVDEDTEMFWMFLRVSHIANCLRSMFHRIWHIYKS